MVNFCAVVGCSNRSTREVEKRFFRLPAARKAGREKIRKLSSKRRALWLDRLRREDVDPTKCSHIRVCSDHFVKGKPAPLHCPEDPDWAPSKDLGHSCVKQKSQDCYNISMARTEKQRRIECAGSLLDLSRVAPGCRCR